MGRTPSEEGRRRNPGEGPRPNTARAMLDDAWRKLSDWDKRQAIRDLAADLRARKGGPRGPG
jgi:hypothetical protein